MFRYRSLAGWSAAALFAAVAFVSANPPQPAAAQTTEELQAQMSDTTSQIQKLQDEIAKLQSQLTTTSAQKLTLQNTVKGLDLQIQKLQKSLSLTQAQIAQKDKDIQTLGSTINTTEGKIGTSQDQIATTLRELDQLTEDSMVAALLGEGTLASFFDQAVSLSTVRDQLQNHVEDLAALKTNLNNSKLTAEQKREQLAALKNDLADQQKGVSVVRSTQSQLLTATQNQEAQYQALIAQKKAEETSFEQALIKLAQGLAPADPSSAPPPQRGLIGWPLASVRITQYFGNTSFAASGAYSGQGHNGVDFAAAVGTPVKAVLGGVVVDTNYITPAQDKVIGYCQYGSWVLVKHPNGLTSLYAHLSSISVSKGQTVAQGQTLGLSGQTGYATGPHLHLTIYISSAVTFKNYTCNNGSVAYIPVAPLNAYLNPFSYLPQ
jgi:murein DD-endopeptidase MepM/ murein hydrolase activator NlpD